MTLRELTKLHRAMGEDLIIDGIHYYMDRNDRVVATATKGLNSADVKLLDGTEIIDDRAFEGYKIRNIRMPSSIIEIKTRGFAGSHLESVEIPKGVTVIGPGAFLWCSRLTNVKFSKGIKEMGYAPFMVILLLNV